MSDTDVKIEALLTKFRNNVDQVRTQLQPLLNVSLIDEISATKKEGQEALPYALTAYALSSMLYAYFRSEGEDIQLVMPELSRIKDMLEKLKQPQTSEHNKHQQKDYKKPVVKTADNKHIRFEDNEKVQKPKKSKKAKKSKFS